MKVRDKLKRNDDTMTEGIAALLMAILASNKFIELDENEEITDHKLYKATCTMVHNYMNTEIEDDGQEEIDKLFEEPVKEVKPEVLSFDDSLVGQQQMLMSLMKDFNNWLGTMSARYRMDKDEVQDLIKDVLK